MKPLLALMAVIATLGVLLLAPLSKASDLEKLYPEQLAQAKNLYQLTHAYFNGSGKLNQDNQLTPNMVKSRLRQEQFYQLWRLIALAVDAGYDISELAEFGIKPNGAGFTIELWHYPQWAKISSLFRRLCNLDEFDYNAQQLQNLGFSEFDIQILRHYIVSNSPYELELLAEREQVSTFISNNAISGSEQTYTKVQALKLHESVRKAREFSWYHWSIQLLDKFNPQKQRALLSYMQQKLGKLALGPRPMQEQYLDRYAQSLKSGKTLAELDDWLAKYNSQNNKEVK